MRTGHTLRNPWSHRSSRCRIFLQDMEVPEPLKGCEDCEGGRRQRILRHTRKRVWISHYWNCANWPSTKTMLIRVTSLRLVAEETGRWEPSTNWVALWPSCTRGMCPLPVPVMSPSALSKLQPPRCDKCTLGTKPRLASPQLWGDCGHQCSGCISSLYLLFQ